MVTINDITFKINEEVIAHIIGLSFEGKKWKRVTKVVDESSMNCFCKADEENLFLRGRFNKEKLPKTWNDVFYMVIKYLTLEEHYKVSYYYHFPLLKHFWYHDEISFPFFLLHDLKVYVIDI